MTYSINSGSDIPAVISSWQRLRKRLKNNNEVDFTNILLNTWRIPLMSMANFQVFKTLEGTIITSLETNDPDDRDAFNQYTTVTMGLVEGRQDGINMRDINIQFYVDINSEV